VTRHPYGETVTRQRATGETDPYSDEATELDWDSPDELAIDGVAVAPGASTESAEADRSRLDIEFTLYMPHGSDVKPLDRVVVRGTAYDVEGKPADWHNPFTGDEPGTVVEVRKVAG
jgi:hypothetical protein